MEQQWEWELNLHAPCGRVCATVQPEVDGIRLLMRPRH